MEKTLSPEERIRRAEEIYWRRKAENNGRKSATVNVSNNKDLRLFKKMILQIAICIMIYLIFYMIQNMNYIFSDDVVKKVNEILSYDINLQKLYEQGKEYVNGFTTTVNNTTDNNEQEQNQQIENNLDIIQEDNTNTENNNIGGEDVEKEKEENVVLSQMELDAKNILETNSLIIPLNGTITSRYGLRNPETPTVPKNHTGIDIAANEGTVFIASMEGVVQEVSSKRRSRKSY